jgi:hypothetical protein
VQVWAGSERMLVAWAKGIKGDTMRKNSLKNGWIVTLASGDLTQDIIVVGGSFDDAVSKARAYAESAYSPGSMRYVQAVRPSLDVLIQES